MTDTVATVERPDEDGVLRTILEGTAGATGKEFFRALVKAVAESLEVCGAWVTELAGESRLRALAFWFGDGFLDDFVYDVHGTPCEAVISECHFVHIPDEVTGRFPEDDDLLGMGAVSYMSGPLQDTDGTVLGTLAILHDEPLPEDPRAIAVFRIFAARAAAELRRLRAEAETREREEELALLLGSAMDGIVEIDPELTIARANRAAGKIFRTATERLAGADLRGLLSRPARLKLRRLMDELDRRPEENRSLWVAGGLEGLRAGGTPFPAEATLSRFDVRGERRYTLILRDVEDRRRAEHQLRSLSAETAYLRGELRALEHFGEIIGESEPLLEAMAEVQRVADTDATVLLQGETGTGKELFARAVHEGSPRAEKPLVRVNCAAMPAALVESELFGHEKGAFTGATSRREGRFALADGGTLLLDEVGELPLELQAKLLRVLQEGEFEPVGSERSRRVDVRVIAATNRDLREDVREGRFRQDLYYRLNVFPITLPPLRERGDDVVLLARSFLEHFASRLGRSVDDLDPTDVARLRAYAWPGNVRELKNVMERAVIRSHDGRLDLASLLPEDAPAAVPVRESASAETREWEAGGAPGNGRPAVPGILTEEELRDLERENIRRALEATGWQVAGADGAATLLGLPPSTLASRMSSLGIERPHEV